ncbi:unnamed protein product [Alternaria alternata]
MGNFKPKPGTNYADATANLKESRNTHTAFCPTESETMSAVILPDWMVDAASSAGSDEQDDQNLGLDAKDKSSATETIDRMIQRFVQQIDKQELMKVTAKEISRATKQLLDEEYFSVKR